MGSLCRISHALSIFKLNIKIFTSTSVPLHLGVRFHQDRVELVLLEVVPDHDGESVDIRNGLLYCVERTIAAGGLPIIGWI